MNSYETLLESFTEDQQMQVFNLMSIGNIDDPNFAAQILAEFDFNIDKAAQKIIDLQTGLDKSYAKDKRMSVEDEAQAGLGKRSAKETEDLRLLYRKYLEKKMAEEEGSLVSESVRKGVNSMISGVKNVWDNIVPGVLKGEATGGEQFKNYLAKNYELLNKRLKFNKGTFEENMDKAHDNKRPLLVYIHIDNPENKELTNQVLADTDLMSLMNIEFYLLGLLADGESAQTVKQYVDIGTDSCLAVFRRNLVDEVQLMESFNITLDTEPKDLIQKLKSVHGSFYLLMLEEEKIKQEVSRQVETQRMHREMETYTNNPYLEDQMQYQNAEQYGVQPHFQAQPYDYMAEQQKLEDARVLRQVQEEEYKEVERKIREKQLREEREEAISREKEEEEEQLKSIQAEERARRAEERRKEVETKLQLLPKEPAQNESNVISIAFRLPDGNRAERRFRTTDKAQALYLFIDTQDVTFDKGTIRYDIFQPRPFLCLDNLDKTIGEYFEGSDQEVVQIREHNA